MCSFLFPSLRRYYHVKKYVSPNLLAKLNVLVNVIVQSTTVFLKLLSSFFRRSIGMQLAYKPLKITYVWQIFERRGKRDY
jgi:hypothetical protein